MHGKYVGEDEKLAELIVRHKKRELLKYEPHHLIELLIRDRERTQSSIQHLLSLGVQNEQTN